MAAVLALTPILIAIVLLLLKQSSWVAALAGAVLAAGLVAFVFPTPAAVLVESGIDYFPLILEVALILLFGMLLARLLESAGSMSQISSWVESLSPGRPLGVALVVFGIVPFAESVTGFGIGVTVGVPILHHLGCTLRQSAILGLLGLIAVPWGALGPGTTVAAALAGLDVDELGLATAWINAIPVIIVAIAVVAIMRPSAASALGIIGSGALMWAGILASSSVIGMAPSGIIGSLIVILLVGALFMIRKRATGLTRRLGMAVLPYGVLTVGLLLARALHAVLPSTVTQIIASPPFWLAAACLIAAITVAGRREVTVAAVRSWIPIGVGTAAFMLMGWIMTTTGMSEAIGSLLPAGLILMTPWLNSIGAVLTGSNTGANSMFTGTLTAAAASSQVSALPVVAAGNAAGSLAALAAPPRVAMAVQIADSSVAASAKDISWVQGRALAVAGINALALGLWIQFFA
ncbi:lactate permease [Brevibacterium iodinum ATCC 49514]|uniref:L-lactate permease n=1 Tax=Brevibacterium iodinum ATCC 49514 TaxID=1255616 RepID=A0A2H1KLD1_9MICO|nr:L-lactate permease [Brevibacterium iodinum]SMY00605.1 lactate permease [Brevibacterium iodinum ATCC 49514]SUW12744.1 L-lactate permease [Brevibacterium iodinum]